MSLYTQLSLDDREKIYRLHADGISLTKIAATLGRAPSTVSREVRRNSSKLGYLPDRADAKARGRKHKPLSKMRRYPELMQFVINKLIIDKWSPEIISARIKMANFSVNISHETIYKFIYSFEGQRQHLYQFLMYRRPKRQLYSGRRHRTTLPEQFHISNRPEAINNRVEPGHFEGDLTFFKGSNSINLLVMVERLTRKTFIVKNRNKKSITTMHNIHSILSSLPSNMRQSITFDNGSEFSKFGTLPLCGTNVYFCKPASPWQKGQVERVNAQLHKFIRKSSDINHISPDQVRDAQDKLNNLPRKVLNFLTPNEAWDIFSSQPVALQT